MTADQVRILEIVGLDRTRICQIKDPSASIVLAKLGTGGEEPSIDFQKSKLNRVKLLLTCLIIETLPEHIRMTT